MWLLLSIGRKVECDMRETRLIDSLLLQFLSIYFIFHDQPTTILLHIYNRLFYLLFSYFSRYKDFTTKHPINAIVKALDPQRSRQKYTYLQN
jgi:hypothetical protein